MAGAVGARIERRRPIPGLFTSRCGGASGAFRGFTASAHNAHANRVEPARPCRDEARAGGRASRVPVAGQGVRSEIAGPTHDSESRGHLSLPRCGCAESVRCAVADRRVASPGRRAESRSGGSQCTASASIARRRPTYGACVDRRSAPLRAEPASIGALRSAPGRAGGGCPEVFALRRLPAHGRGAAAAGCA